MVGSKTDPRAKVQELLEKTAGQVMGIAGDAGRENNMKAAFEITELSKSLLSLRERIGSGAQVAMSDTPAASAVALRNGVTKKSAAKGTGRQVQKAQPGEAKFTREGEKLLIRSGYSKKSKKAYSHRVPSELIEDLCFACMAAGEGVASFTMDDLKKDAELKAKQETKGYSQGYYYDVLKWFGETGFVESAGLRGRYRLGEGADYNFPPGYLKDEFMRLPEERHSGEKRAQ